MKEINTIAEKIEAKLKKLEAQREEISEKVQAKRATVARLELALQNLRTFEGAGS